ncbi:MAG: AEC family transporter [Lachnospiraceae bacterium]|nr:AEC family transporter [Lachnospiraceae bacterium]
MSNVNVLNQIFIIYFGIIAGFVFRKLKVLTEERTSALSAIVVNIVLPFYIFSAILRTDAGVDAKGVLVTLGLSTGFFLVCGLIGIVVTALLRPKKEDRGVYLFELMCSNVAYIGIPVCGAVLGETGRFYGALLNIPYNLICFSLGIFLLAGRMPLKKILNPVFITGLIAAVLFMLKVPVPELVLDGCAFIGQATSPCAMFIIGSALGGIPIRELFTEWRVIPYLILRLFGLAAIIAALLSFVPVDETLKGMLILMAALPAATNSTMLCTIYGGNRALSAKLIFLSTALCGITIPLWAALYFKV